MTKQPKPSEESMTKANFILSQIMQSRTPRQQMALIARALDERYEAGRKSVKFPNEWGVK